MGTPLQRALEQLSILAVWNEVGGGELRHGRGRAFWRNGGGFNVSIRAEEGTWHDFVTGSGGNMVSLVCTALDMAPGEAARWLIEFAGIEDRPMTGAERRERQCAEFEQEHARLFSLGAVTVAEHCLEVFFLADPSRPDLTELIADIRRDHVSVFREYQRHNPALAKGLVHAGRQELIRREDAAALELNEVFARAN
jgi:hypothetical protein